MGQKSSTITNVSYNIEIHRTCPLTLGDRMNFLNLTALRFPRRQMLRSVITSIIIIIIIIIIIMSLTVRRPFDTVSGAAIWRKYLDLNTD